MNARLIIGAALLAGAGYIAYDVWRNGLDGLLEPPVGSDAGDTPLTDTTTPDPADIGDSYYAKLAQVESSNRPYVKAPTSSASGLYQFTKATWQAAGGTWGGDPTKAFGGLTPSAQEQTMRAAKLTTQNANLLQRAGVAISDAALYAAHFLGANTAATILGHDPNALVASVVPQNYITANPFLNGMTVGGFTDWLNGKMA